MSDTLVVAVSQSGSTTDTNRAVDLARARGSAVVSIINRRDSDLGHKSDGVADTSDGRDAEMAVASTKGVLRPDRCRIAARPGTGSYRASSRPEPRSSVDRITPRRTGSARNDLVERRCGARCRANCRDRLPELGGRGLGPEPVAANEVRIKLSQLCYKAVAVDAIEDKKHIDLSAEALVIVCAAGAPPNQIADLAKEVEILKAHNNRAMVICDADTIDIWSTDLVIPIPSAHPTFAWLLATAAGHHFSYHAALAIDATAQPLRQALQELEHLVDTLARDQPNAARGSRPSD